MLDFVQNFIYKFLAIQEKLLNRRFGKKLPSVYSNTTSKKVFGLAASLELTSKTEKSKEKLENDLKAILKKYENNPNKLFEYVQKNGTMVYKIPFADKVLAVIKQEEGLICSTNGLKALYLNIILPLLSGKNPVFSCKTEPIFVLRNLPIDNYCMIQHFYKWYAMKLKMPGFDTESQENFQKFLTPTNDDKIKDLSIEEILGLKEAIARDVEAINFIVDMAKTTTGSKNALKKMTAGGASI